MTVIDVPVCQCPLCQQETDHAERERHRQLLLVFSRLDENQRRWFVALESKRLGYGGDHLLSQITGMDEKTIRRGRTELDARWPTIRRSASGALAVGDHRLKKRPRDSAGLAGGRGARNGRRIRWASRSGCAAVCAA
jgi:hypothetical protein